MGLRHARAHVIILYPDAYNFFLHGWEIICTFAPANRQNGFAERKRIDGLIPIV